MVSIISLSFLSTLLLSSLLSPELVGSFYLDGQLTFHPYLARSAPRPVKSATAAAALFEARPKKLPEFSVRKWRDRSGVSHLGLREIPHVLSRCTMSVKRPTLWFVSFHRVSTLQASIGMRHESVYAAGWPI